MLTAVKEALTIAPLQLAPATAQLPAVIDEVATKRTIKGAYQAAIDLERRFEVVFTGMGKHVANLPSVKFARDIRVGDGTPQGYITTMMKRAVLLASPAGIGMLMAFGAAGAGDLACFLAAGVPFAWVPVSAVRSMRAERVAARDIAAASIVKATVDDVEKIESFVKKLTADGNPLTAAVAKRVITEWLAKGEAEEFLSTSAVTRLLALRDGIADPTGDDGVAAERLLGAARLVTSFAERRDRMRSADLPAVEQAIGAVNGLEREALASRWHTELVGRIGDNGVSKVQQAIKALLPKAELSNTTPKHVIGVEYVRPKAAP